MKKISIIVFIAISTLLSFACQRNPNGNFSLLPRVQTDASINAAVAAAIANDPLLTGLPLTISTTQGTVVLSGYVKTIRQSDTVVSLASKVNGVKLVENHLIVRK